MARGPILGLLMKIYELAVMGGELDAHDMRPEYSLANLLFVLFHP
jgi:hypothetical protein